MSNPIAHPIDTAKMLIRAADLFTNKAQRLRDAAASATETQVLADFLLALHLQSDISRKDGESDDDVSRYELLSDDSSVGAIASTSFVGRSDTHQPRPSYNASRYPIHGVKVVKSSVPEHLGMQSYDMARVPHVFPSDRTPRSSTVYASHPDRTPAGAAVAYAAEQRIAGSSISTAPRSTNNSFDRAFSGIQVVRGAYNLD